jgi:histone deacetylase complex regulatory component SIN3
VGQSFGNPSLMTVGVGVTTNGRSISPVGPAPSLAPATNTYENNNVASSTFTHSYSSSFVPHFPSLQSQPVEFNHAINYVNKIKVTKILREKEFVDSSDYTLSVECETRRRLF